ncbi:sulfotransferase family protein [Nocardioides sp. SYSU DS0651]|uniref:sulfotransferase family protein n=1 Tax=Nocardioides sp. SYSU DS0651 TaxID=3415955 RepID=UPI003F4B3507
MGVRGRAVEVAGALPTVVVVGAMKGGTSALHEHIDEHPDVAMSRPKELNFFNGPTRPPHDDAARWWQDGQWHRGVGWYAEQFDPTVPARGESSPGYTSPSHPEVAERMAAVLPGVRLVYLVRDPLARALSQYAHHRRDGSEPRPPGQALLDPASQYVARSRYVERLRPFLDVFGPEQVHIVVQERLLTRPGPEMARVFEHVGVDPSAVRAEAFRKVVHRGDPAPPVGAEVRTAFARQVADDVEELRDLLGDRLEEWRLQ